MTPGELAANFELATAAESGIGGGAATFTQFRSIANLVMTGLVVMVASTLFHRIDRRVQTGITAIALAVFLTAAVAVFWGWSNTAAMLTFASLTTTLRLLLFLTACRHFAALSIPLTAGAQFTTYMAVLNGADIAAAWAVGGW